MPADDTTLPTPPADIPKYIREPLKKQSAARLRHISQYAQELADAKDRREQEQQEKTGEEDDQEDTDVEEPDRDQHEDLPEGVPAKASITIKEINNNRYYYWQWREGDKIRSQYKGPVNPDE